MLFGSCFMFVSIAVSKIHQFLISWITYNSPVLCFLRMVRFCTTGVMNTKFIERIFIISYYFLWENALRIPRNRRTLDFIGIHAALSNDAELSGLHVCFLSQYLQCAQGVVIPVACAGR
jgi:hypothetical protein